MPTRTTIRLLLISMALAFLVGVAGDRLVDTRRAYADYGYYLAWYLVVLTLACRWELGAWLRRHAGAVAAGTALTALILWSGHAAPRNVAGATSLLDTSLSMYLFKKANAVSEGYRYWSHLHAASVTGGGAPLVFPFLVSLLKTFGDALPGPLLVDAVAGVAALLGVFRLAEDAAGRRAGYVAMALLAACPLFPAHVLGGGSEPLILALAAVATSLVARAWTAPRAIALERALLVLAALANCTMVGPVLFAVLAPLLLWRARALAEPLPARLALIPLALVPAIWRLSFNPATAAQRLAWAAPALVAVALPAAILGLALGLARLAARPGLRPVALVLWLQALALSYAYPETRDPARRSVAAQDLGASLRALAKYPRATTLIIADKPARFIAHGYGAIGVKRANADAEGLLTDLETGLYQNIVVVRRRDLTTGTYARELSERFALAAPARFYLGEDQQLEIAEVVAGLAPEPLPDKRPPRGAYVPI